MEDLPRAYRQPSRHRAAVFVVAIILLVVSVVASSGCVRPCGTYERRGVWHQEEVPNSYAGVIFRYENVTGNVWVEDPDGRVTLTASHETRYPTSHELREVGKIAFEGMGWPEPTFEGMKESTGCLDHL